MTDGSDGEVQVSAANLILWCVAIAEKPVTPAEVKEVVNGEIGKNVTRQTVSTTLMRQAKCDLLHRRRRSNGDRGPNPYEYVLSDEFGMPVLITGEDENGGRYDDD